VPGLGPARRKTLLKHFGSVRKLGAASTEEIAEVPGIGPKLAVTISAALHAAENNAGSNRSGESHGDA
jgi:excinuclease ABC subunit C